MSLALQHPNHHTLGARHRSTTNSLRCAAHVLAHAAGGRARARAIANGRSRVARTVGKPPPIRHLVQADPTIHLAKLQNGVVLFARGDRHQVALALVEQGPTMQLRVVPALEGCDID